MIYIINNTIHFRDDDGVIWVDGDEESSYTLTATTSRLLAFLLQRQGEVLTRDLILTHVWDNYGLRSSNSSLNKYISDLRNILRNLGCTEEVILTLPRIGFSVSENTIIEVIEKQQSMESEKTKEKSKNNNFTNSIIISLFSILLMAFISLWLVIIHTNAKDNAPPYQSTYSFGQVDGCNISTLKEISPEMSKMVSTIVKNIVDREGIKCIHDSIVFLQISDAVLYGNTGRVFLSYCMLNKTSKTISACNSTYQVDYDYKK